MFLKQGKNFLLEREVTKNKDQKVSNKIREGNFEGKKPQDESVN